MTNAPDISKEAVERLASNFSLMSQSGLVPNDHCARSTAANAQAAYDAAIAQARREGYEQAIAECADATQELARSSDNDVEDAFNDGLTEAHDAIQALEYKEPKT